MTAPRAVRLDTGLELLSERLLAGMAPAVLATVVATAGSTYRKPGARMLFLADGGQVGLLSGGCLEADLELHARQILEGAAARSVEYDMRGPDDMLFGIGAGCEGAMRVLLEPLSFAAPPAAALREAARVNASGAAACLVSIHESREHALGTRDLAGVCADLPAAPAAALVAAAEAALAEGASRDFASGEGAARLCAHIQYLAPPPHLLICGAGPDAQPVSAAARVLGWRVTVVDHRPAYADPARFPGARVLRRDAASLADHVDLERCHAAVVMSHHLASDLAYLRILGEARGPGYVGLLGPPARRQRILAELGRGADGLGERLQSPVGLEIGACTPEGIALAILGAVHAWLAGRNVASMQQPERARVATRRLAVARGNT